MRLDPETAIALLVDRVGLARHRPDLVTQTEFGGVITGGFLETTRALVKFCRGGNPVIDTVMEADICLNRLSQQYGMQKVAIRESEPQPEPAPQPQQVMPSDWPPVTPMPDPEPEVEVAARDEPSAGVSEELD